MKSTVRLSDGRVIVIERLEYDEPSPDIYPRFSYGPPRATLDGVEITEDEALKLIEPDLP